MKALLTAINNRIAKALNEQHINLLTDLDDENVQPFDSIQNKDINTNVYLLQRGLLNAIHTGEISIKLKNQINNPENYNKFKGIIKAKNTEHLKELIKIGQQLFGNDGNFNWIDTSEITNMSQLFQYNTEFNGHIELWDVSNVKDMSYMFCDAESFNQPIGNWDVSMVETFRYMFCDAELFNQPIGNWDVSNATDMSGMFTHTYTFNQPIDQWDVSNVKDMSAMFYSATHFNQSLYNWNMQNVENLQGMFFQAAQFDQDISSWRIPKISTHTCQHENMIMFILCPIQNNNKPLKFRK